MTIEKVNRIKEILEHLPATKLEGLKKLFWEELNYDVDNTPLSQASWPDDFNELFESTPVSFATYASNNEFHVIYIQLKGGKLLIGAERRIVNTLIKDYPYSLFVFSNEDQNHWHFVNAISDQEKKSVKQRILRRISVSTDDRLRTASERITCLDTAEVVRDLFGVSPISIQQQHDNAFDVEEVTKEFFNEYKAIFTSLKTALFQQANDRVWAHDFSLQFMNRLMFIYYIERKRWLGDNPYFLYGFWREYLKTQRGTDTFVDEWLHVLFFEAFNDKFAAGRTDLAFIPETFREALQFAPYLNGGLFSRNELDDKYPYLIKDALMGDVFDFLDKYNFTISEDTPLDQEVAVDPEMIGKVYESLVNVSEEADEQSEAGIYYTPRIEIDLMCRLSLVDWFSNQLPVVNKNVFYEMVFAFSPDEKEDADKCINEQNLWPEIDKLLTSITVLDPACGSGSFLVGMLGILDDLIVRAETYLGRVETPYERRKRIIGNSLYGVDIMEWAVHVAELRLWLQLVIETELDLGERRTHPLLPNLSFKIRHGDSLVQEVGGINFSLYRQGGNLKGSTKSKLNALKAEKVKFYQNDPTCKYHNNTQVEQDEFLLFNQIIDDQIDSQKNKQAEMVEALSPKKNLFGEVQEAQMDINKANQTKELEQLRIDLVRLQEAKKTLQTQREVPFVWDIAFVEIFEGEKRGFDIVIGNPPYTRHKDIRDLTLPPERVTKENKKAYKDKLAKAVYNAWPKTFGYNPARGTVTWELDKRSDLYIYFYLISLSLLNSKGSFCFITSNAWLDVGYGADLQSFLLTRAKVRFVIDNQVKRSFRADVNTIIILISPPNDSKTNMLACMENVACFVMFKVLYKEGLSPIIWEEIEEITEKKVSLEYRVIKASQTDLFNEGLDGETKTYAGDKWGGKYLRAPDIYWYILEKCKDYLAPLNQIADVTRGVSTGANEFFYLDQEQINHWGIEEEYLVPVIRSPRECKRFRVQDSELVSKLIYCNKPRSKLAGTNLLEYIKWGERMDFHNRPSCKTRKYWWFVGEHSIPDMIWMKAFNDKYVYPYNFSKILLGDRLYEISFFNKYETINLVYALNNSLTMMSTELNGRVALGLGALDNMTYEAGLNTVIIPTVIPSGLPLIEREIMPIQEELDQLDKQQIEEALFLSLGLTRIELDTLQEELIKLSSNRLKRAGSY